MSFCPESGKEIGEESRFCPECGTDISERKEDGNGQRIWKISTVVLVVVLFFMGVILTSDQMVQDDTNPGTGTATDEKKLPELLSVIPENDELPGSWVGGEWKNFTNVASPWPIQYMGSSVLKYREFETGVISSFYSGFRRWEQMKGEPHLNLKYVVLSFAAEQKSKEFMENWRAEFEDNYEILGGDGFRKFYAVSLGDEAFGYYTLNQDVIIFRESNFIVKSKLMFTIEENRGMVFPYAKIMKDKIKRL